ncbi:MAG: hypothetical protein JWM59_1735 [Verrucomicrobiales bacterium]|nr:hypothetical protein [Verrucomicrobiales bacterium]
MLAEKELKALKWSKLPALVNQMEKCGWRAELVPMVTGPGLIVDSGLLVSGAVDGFSMGCPIWLPAAGMRTSAFWGSLRSMALKLFSVFLKISNR